MYNIFYKVVESVDKNYDIELVGKRTTNSDEPKTSLIFSLDILTSNYFIFIFIFIN